MEWFNPAAFEFEHAPLNKAWQAVAIIGAYFIAIITIEQLALRGKIPQAVVAVTKQLQIYHNLALSVASLIMLAGCSITALQMRNHLWMDEPDSQYPAFMICSQVAEKAKGRLWYWIYLFYLSKYWELADTILQMFKGRRPPSYHFHVWHHTVYLLICYYYCAHRASLAPTAVLVNTSVHVVMYYYYHLNCRGIAPWWKHHIPQMQIVQFIIGYCMLTWFTKLYVIDGIQCQGTTTLAVHAAFNFTMLVGFINILRRVTRSSTKQQLGKAGSEVASAVKHRLLNKAN